ncbi:tyrosine-type recombinase/integrase [Micromonospora sp. URMC 103]|uniref:tyrosine-type recombinase/integrase n=1 Tax=Micromonospora sp. URMC 103 TaxID=3423406 RepID=UPI003F1ADFDE
MPPRYRALVLVTTFGCLRWGEVAALQRQDIDTAAGTIRVRQAYTELRGVGLVLGPPKSRAGRRTVSLPPAVVEVVRDHLAAEVDDNLDAFVFTTESGRPIWRGNLNKLISWKANVARIGQPDLHFHDLRHTGNTLAARTGASTRDLMARMGHDSTQAALIYQHATAEADRAIAQALHDAVRADQKKAKKTTGGGKDKGGKKSVARRARSARPTGTKPAASRANGTPMARRMILDLQASKALAGAVVLARALIVERVTGIDPALSAWELDKIGSSCWVAAGRSGPGRPGLASCGTRLWPVDGPALLAVAALPPSPDRCRILGSRTGSRVAAGHRRSRREAPLTPAERRGELSTGGRDTAPCLVASRRVDSTISRGAVMIPVMTDTRKDHAA